MSRKAALIAGLFVLLFGAAALAGALLYLKSNGPPAPSSVGGPFTLVDQDGRTVTEKDFAGKPFLVFFGYTHCPDFCPATLFEISEGLNRLGPQAAGLSVLFISTDPERDKAEVLKTYLSNFNPSIRGLTGSEEQVRDVQRKYRAYAEKVPGEGGDYSVNHSTVVYLMDGEGRFVAPFNTKRPPEQLAADLKKYL